MSSPLLVMLVIKQKDDSPHWDDCDKNVTGRCFFTIFNAGTELKIRQASSASRPVVSFSLPLFGSFIHAEKQ